MLFLIQSEDGRLVLKRGEGLALPVLTVAQAAQRLRRSRRQVYRLMQDRLLGPTQKLLGEWLLDEREVARLAARPRQAQPIPQSISGFFSDLPAHALNAGQDRLLIVSRILEHGGLRELRWLYRRYGTADLRRFMSREGRRALSHGSRRLWSLVFGARGPRAKAPEAAAPPAASDAAAEPSHGPPTLPELADRLLGAALNHGGPARWKEFRAFAAAAGLGRALEAAATLHPERPNFVLEAARRLTSSPALGKALREQLAAHLRRTLGQGRNK